MIGYLQLSFLFYRQSQLSNPCFRHRDFSLYSLPIRRVTYRKPCSTSLVAHDESDPNRDHSASLLIANYMFDTELKARYIHLFFPSFSRSQWVLTYPLAVVLQSHRSELGKSVKQPCALCGRWHLSFFFGLWWISSTMVQQQNRPQTRSRSKPSTVGWQKSRESVISHTNSSRLINNKTNKTFIGNSGKNIYYKDLLTK